MVLLFKGSSMLKIDKLINILIHNKNVKIFDLLYKKIESKNFSIF